MALSLPNFLAAQLVNPDYSGIGDSVSNYYAGKAMPKDDLIKAVQAQFAKPKAEADLASTQASTASSRTSTALNNLKLQYPGLGESGIMGQLAYAKLLSDRPEFVKSLSTALGGGKPSQDPSASNPLSLILKNINADIGQKESLASYRMAGGGGGGVTQKQQAFLQNQLMKDNPGFTPQQAFEAAGQLVQGERTLGDGTPFNASGLTQLSAAKSVLQGTTSGLATQGVKAAQAEAEIPVADKYISEGIAPYGDTFMGRSPQQLKDMTNTKDKSAQERLGKYQAAQLLQLEKSALALKMAGVETGVTIMDEAISKANQSIKKTDISQTSYARKVALDTYREALKEMLKQRKGVGILQSGLTGVLKDRRNKEENAVSQSKNKLSYNPATGEFE